MVDSAGWYNAFVLHWGSIQAHMQCALSVMAPSPLEDDVPYSIRRHLALAAGGHAETGAADVPESSRVVSEPALPATGSTSSGTALGSRERSRSGRRRDRSSGASRALLLPNRHHRREGGRSSREASATPRGPSPPVPVNQPADVAAGHVGAVFSPLSARSPGSSDSSEIQRRHELRDREGTPAWSLGDSASRRAAVERDRSARTGDRNPLDVFLQEDQEMGEESGGGEDDPFATDSEDRASLRDRAGDFHTTADVAGDEEVNTHDLASCSWPSPPTDSCSCDGLGHEPQTKD